MYKLSYLLLIFSLSSMAFANPPGFGGFGRGGFGRGYSRTPSHTPSYRAPSSNSYQSPSSQAPSYRAPAYQQPVYHTPAPAPVYRAPAYTPPSSTYRTPTPVYRTPTYTPPSSTYRAPAPAYHAPTAYRPQTPAYQSQRPTYQTQTPAYRSQAPINQTPAVTNRAQAPMSRAPVSTQPSANRVQTPGSQLQRTQTYHSPTSSAANSLQLHNRIPPEHQQRVYAANDRVGRVMVTNPQVRAFVTPHVETFARVYQPVIVNQYSIYAGYCGRWGGYWLGSPWIRWGFWGGFVYPLYPIYDIQVYFWNPLIFWLYVDAWNETYYRTWYTTSYDSYASLRTRFSVPGVFYPTQELTHLALGVSGMSEFEQGNFMLAMNDLVNRLGYKLSERMGTNTILNRNEIVMNHYEMFNNAVVLEGFVATPMVQFPFKAVIDLTSTRPDYTSRLFVPRTDGGQPSEAEVYELQELNRRIAELGGSISTTPPGPQNPY